MKRLAIPFAVAILTLTAPLAAAAWTTSASGAGTVASTSVAQANQPIATRGAGKVTLSWEASTLVSGDPVQGYRVLRHVGSAVSDVCTVTAPTLTCDDTAPVPGMASYGLVATVGSWTGPESELSSFTYDTVAPVTTADVSPAPNAAGWSRTAVHVTLTATDAGAGVDHVTYAVAGADPVTVHGSTTSFPVSGTGIHEVTYFAADTVGNTERPQTLTVRIDPDAPFTTVTPNDSVAWHKTDVVLRFSATDAESGVRSITIDGDTNAGDSAEKSISAEGTHIVSYFATDEADNAEGPRGTTVKIDKTAPVATITPETSAAWITQPTQPVTITATDTAGPSGANSGVASVVYAVDGGPATTVNSGSANFLLGQGPHTVTYYAVDVAGNAQATQSASIKLDDVAPRTTFNQAPDNGPVTLSATDPTSGVAIIRYRIGSTGDYTTVTGNSATLDLANGVQTLWFYAVDAAGNQETPQSRVVTIGNADTMAPVISNLDPASPEFSAHNNNTNSPQAWVNKACQTGKICATVTDDGSGVLATSIAYTLIGTSGANMDRCWTGTAFTRGTSCAVPMSYDASNGRAVSNNIPQSEMADGNYQLAIKATDVAGNERVVQISIVIN